MKGILRAALAATALVALSAGASAQQTVIWWDFLGGGDGVRMKKLIEDFNNAHKGEIEIQATTLDWGVPFYTKVQTSAAVGEGPDVMTYHTSRIPLAVSQNVLQEITAEDWAALGMNQDSFAPAIWEAVNVDGKQYAVPLDTHPIVLYYNKDKLAAAGLIGEDGLPKGLNGIENFSAAMKKLQEGGTKWGLSTFNAAGDFQFRTIYSLLCQQDGEMLTDGEWLAGDNLDKLTNAVKVVSDWVKDGYVSPYTEYPAGIALFTSGEAAMHINGVWEVPTFTDLASKNELGFEWGAIELPVFFDHPCTYSDSHAFAIPNNVGKEMTPEKRAAVLEVIKEIVNQGLFWATAGHIPALKSVTESAEYQAMEPNATYAVLTANMVYDPKSRFAGVASPMFSAAGNAFTAAVNGEVDPADAVADMKAELDSLQ
jgi:multiple sugar transport system substrate-binding protein